MNLPISHAKGGQVPLTMKFDGPQMVASLSTRGGSLPTGAQSGSFEKSWPNVDIRQLLSYEEAAIRDRCTAVLDDNKVASVPYAYDVGITFSANGPTGNPVVSTTVPYQLSLICKRS